MRIGINAHLLSLLPTYRSAGISRHIYNLLLGLAEFDHQNNYVVFGNESHLATLLGNQRNFEIRPSLLPTEEPIWRVAFEQTMLPYLIKRYRLDIFHAPANVLPWQLSCPGVVTIHDLSFLHYPEQFVWAKCKYQKFFTAQSVRRANLIITVSETTKAEVIDHFRIDTAKIIVCYNSIHPRFQPIKDEKTLASFRINHQLPEKFILYMGTLQPRKNLEVLVQAFELLHRHYELPHTLVIAGAKGWLFERIFSYVKELGLGRRILFPGFIPDEEQPLWYRSAELFVYPSICEGFGLPVVEAMACGTPVVTSNVSSLPEIGGDAVLTADPHDAKDLAKKMNIALTDATVSSHLRLKGVIRAAQFSVRNMTERILNAYETIGYR